MIGKRGQITVFIIIGILILVSVSLFFFLKPKLTETDSEINKAQEISLGVIPIKTYIESCINSVGSDALVHIGKHGGYLELPEKSTRRYFTETAYYFYIYEEIIPSKSTIEQELSRYLDRELSFCLKNFTDFKKMGFDIEQGTVNTITAIRPGSVLFKVDFPIIVKKESTETRFDSFSKPIDNLRLKTIYEASRNITLEQLEHPESICLSCIVAVATENELYVDMERMGNDTLLFIITDPSSEIDNIPYRYFFAHKYREYSCMDPPPESDASFYINCINKKIAESGYEFYLEDIPDMNVSVNETLYYKVNASGLNLTFTDYSPLFDIDKKTGVINFTLSEEQIGTHTIWIYVKDQIGNEDYASFTLNIINVTAKND